MNSTKKAIWKRVKVDVRQHYIGLGLATTSIALCTDTFLFSLNFFWKAYKYLTQWCRYKTFIFGSLYYLAGHYGSGSGSYFAGHYGFEFGSGSLIFVKNITFYIENAVFILCIFPPRDLILNDNFGSGEVITDPDPDPTSHVINDLDLDSQKVSSGSGSETLI